jgi:hypothetical protein
MLKKTRTRGKTPTYSRSPGTKRADFAEALKVSGSRVSQLWALGMPRGSVAAAVEWYQSSVDRREPRVGVTVGGRTKTLTELRCEKLILDIERGRMDAGLRKKDLITLESAKHTMGLCVDVLRKGYRSMESWCAVRYALDAKERRAITDKFDEIERSNADRLRQLIEEDGK